MDVKNIIEKSNNSPVVIFVCNLFTIISFPFLFFSDSIFLKVLVIILVFILAIFAIGRFTRISKKKKEWLNEHLQQQEILFSAIEDFNYNYSKCFEGFKNESNISYESVDNLCKNICNAIEDIVSVALDAKVCVCIKLFDKMTQMNNDISTWKLYTIGRSKSTPRSRRKNETKQVFLCENSDFEEIVRGNIDVFLAPDIPDLIKRWDKDNKEYKNSRKNMKNIILQQWSFLLKRNMKKLLMRFVLTVPILHPTHII